MFKSVAPGGAYKGAAQSGGFNHNHASQMGHVAASRLKFRQAMSGAAPAGVPDDHMVGSQAPGAPPAHGNFKAHIAHAVHAHTGHPVTHNAVLQAIDGVTAKGGFTPAQGNALKAHKGPLVGPGGHDTMAKIANHMISGGV